MPRKKIVMEQHRKVMIGLLQTKPLTSQDFYRKAMENGIPKATFYKIRNDEGLKPL
jgi:predicted transcriptional regulator